MKMNVESHNRVASTSGSFLDELMSSTWSDDNDYELVFDAGDVGDEELLGMDAFSKSYEVRAEST